MRGWEPLGVRDIFSTIDRPNLAESVRARITAALVAGELKPGDKLRIRPLAEQLGTSVTPVRDALLGLIGDGVLESRTPKDVRVPAIRLGDYEEIRIIRLRAEGLAARMAALNATAGDVALLRDLVERNEAARLDGPTSEALRLNQIFHFEIARIAAMPILADIIRRLWLRMGPIIAAIYVAGGRTMIDHHYPILEAIAAGDGDAAERAMQADIEAAADFVRAAGLLAED